MPIWPFKRPAAVETKSLGDPTETELAILTSTTLPYNTEALATSAAYACVSLTSGAVSALEIGVEKRSTKREPVDHPALPLVRVEANPWTDGSMFLRDLISQALTSGDPQAIVLRNGEGKPVQLIAYAPGRITRQLASDGSGEPTYRLNGSLLDPRDVIDVRGPFSKPPMALARNAIAAAAAMERHIVNLFQKGARPGGTIEVPNAVGEDAIKRIKAGWKAANEGIDNAGKTAILYNGAKYTPFQLSSVDAQLLELRRFAVEEIARFFNLAPSMIGDQTKSSYSKGSQSQLEALVFAIEPWLFAVEGALNRVLLTDEERKTLTFRFQRDDLTRASLTERANAINSLIASETINPNTGRDWLGLPAYPEGEAYGNRNITVKPAADQVPPNA